MESLQSIPKVGEAEQAFNGQKAEVPIPLTETTLIPSELNHSALEEPTDTDLEKLDVIPKVADPSGSDVKMESDSSSGKALTASSSDSPKSSKPESVANQNGNAIEYEEGEEAVKEEEDPEQGQPSKAMALDESAIPVAIEAMKSKSKKKNNNVWVTKSTRKGKKKRKANTPTPVVEDQVLIIPVPMVPDKGDDTPDLEICLSKVYKAEKVDISEDRLTAGSSKGYRMVRATRGVVEGAWYFEIKVMSLGETGHTRLGWSTDKGDLLAPVGYDGNSFGFRNIDGCKIHKALREKYAEEGYKEGDVVGFYINLPDGSEISFFKNGVCQGVTYKDIFGGRYYPASSMYTLPDQSNCLVRFNFGPDFEYFPEDFGGRAIPRLIWEVPYHGYNGRLENNGSADMKM